MLKKILAILSCLCFCTACASTGAARHSEAKPKAFVTPWEYYQKARLAVWRPEDSAKIQKTAVHSTGEDTSSDKTQMVLIGTLVGVAVVGGTVAGILIAK